MERCDFCNRKAKVETILGDVLSALTKEEVFSGASGIMSIKLGFTTVLVKLFTTFYIRC
jgi:hypothetical protein